MKQRSRIYDFVRYLLRDTVPSRVVRGCLVLSLALGVLGIAHVQDLPVAEATTCPGPDVGGYTCTVTTGVAIVPGTVDIGNHCDDCVNAPIPLPFPFTFYSQTHNSVNISSNGNVQFLSTSSDYTNSPLPYGSFNQAILPFWDDLRTDANCTTIPDEGIYTSVSGAAPSRIFNIEWRACLYAANTSTANFEVRLFETSNEILVVYGASTDSGSDATAGIQRGTGSAFLEFSAFSPVLTSGKAVRYVPNAPNRSVATSVSNPPPPPPTPSIPSGRVTPTLIPAPH